MLSVQSALLMTLFIQLVTSTWFSFALALIEHHAVADDCTSNTTINVRTRPFDKSYQHPRELQPYNTNTNTTLLMNNNRIVGGTPAEYNEFPSFAFVYLGCGGTLIHPDIFITAAHCRGVFRDGVMIGGTVYDGSESEHHTVEYEIAHPQYKRYSNFNFQNDIMLVKLTKPSSAPIQPMNFDTTIPIADNTMYATAIGFGFVEEDGTLPYQLRKVDIIVNDAETCNSIDSRLLNHLYVPESMICAGLTALGGKDTCNGDSGGPLLYKSSSLSSDDGGKQSIIGITSFGLGCARPNFAGYYTRISYYEDFIKDTICQFSSIPDSNNNIDCSGRPRKCQCQKFHFFCKLRKRCSIFT